MIIAGRYIPDFIWRLEMGPELAPRGPETATPDPEVDLRIRTGEDSTSVPVIDPNYIGGLILRAEAIKRKRQLALRLGGLVVNAA